MKSWQRIFNMTLILGVTSLLHADDFQAGTPNPGRPELGQLRRFEGVWTAELPNSTDSVSSRRKWILNGMFLEHDFELSNGDVRGKILRGFDVEHQRYTLTIFVSSGGTEQLTGYWDEDLKTMTFNAANGSSEIQKYESYFPDDQTEKWTITLQSGGQVSATAKKRPE